MSKLDNITVTIDKNKVYASYYARACRIMPDSKLVAISIGIPDNFKGEILRELNPTQDLLYKYKNKLVDEQGYKEIYLNEVLSKLDAEEIYQKVKGKVICCYCGKNSFCHRKLVLDWLATELSADIIGGEI